jgi:hypothetical protein
MLSLANNTDSLIQIKDFVQKKLVLLKQFTMMLNSLRNFPSIFSLNALFSFWFVCNIVIFGG